MGSFVLVSIACLQASVDYKDLEFSGTDALEPVEVSADAALGLTCDHHTS